VVDIVDCRWHAAGLRAQARSQLLRFVPTRVAHKVSPDKISSLAEPLSMGTNPQCASSQTLSVFSDQWKVRATLRACRLLALFLPPR